MAVSFLQVVGLQEPPRNTSHLQVSLLERRPRLVYCLALCRSEVTGYKLKRGKVESDTTNTPPSQEVLVLVTVMC